MNSLKRYANINLSGKNIGNLFKKKQKNKE